MSSYNNMRILKTVIRSENNVIYLVKANLIALTVRLLTVKVVYYGNAFWKLENPLKTV